ncbi:MAG: GNAT family N-acetyltransferase [Arcicella sp.]|jgi:GNAT superfamily N-acetyltransferase|nr:GNAT family N-acetyltransferase [Arcicella sp.]
MITYRTFRGSDIESIFENLAQLRITVFRDYPYLYEGTLDYERAYLQTYSNAERAFVFTVFDDEKLVGATTCIPLEDETLEVKKPFLEANLNIERIFYFGESILLKEYRGLGLGNRFFEERENHAKRFGTFDVVCFCAVQRENNHPLKPKDYRALDDFWIKKGYKKQINLESSFEWLDIGEPKPTNKPMIYWMKNI